MVAWTAPQDGGLNVYTSEVLFSSPGTVDTNSITRKQYSTPLEGGFGGNEQVGHLFSEITLDIDNPGDKPLVGNTKGICVLYAIAKASSFAAGVVPTPAQILALGNANLWLYTDPYSNSFDADSAGSWAGSVWPGYFDNLPLQPGSKYWMLALPAIFKYTDGSTRKKYPAVTVENYPPITGFTANSIGRAVSFWTNRTPNAPVITSPASGSIIPPSSAFALSIQSNDPDGITGTNAFRDDMAGVQVQIAPRPTSDNPTPTWTDMAFGDAAGAALGPGWAIYKSTAPELPANAGAFQLLRNKTVQVRAGSNSIGVNEGRIPGGDWQIRVRTFDWGTPGANESTNFYDAKPWGFNNAQKVNLKPANAPAFNTSPWSDAVTVSIPSQVPPPVPLSPINAVAVIDSVPITLVYQYRNTATPPFAQAHRTIQYRKVGDTVWTTLVDENSASASYTVAVGVFQTGNEYEWQVQTTDTDGKVSNYSTIGRFWVVSTPASGSERPNPDETIDGATLGCGVYRVEVYRRGGRRRVGEIKGITSLDWGRTRDDISTSKVVVADWDIDCGNLLSKLQTWAYEIRITRDNGFSVDHVWEGPITLLTYEKDSVTIQAKDVMAYAYRRIIRQAMSDTGTALTAGSTVVNRAMRVLQNAFAPDDPNILAYLSVLTQDDDAKQYRSTPAYSRTAFEEVDDMAANAGLDYTAVGRAILLWGTKHRIGTLPEFTDDDLGSPPIVSEYGMSMANVYSVSDGNGVYGLATRGGVTESGGVVSGNDPIYGLVEMLSSSWASDSPDDTGTYTQAGLQTIIASFEGYAERSIADRYGPPVVVRVPDNTTLNPNTTISIQQLVPGVVIPLRSTGTLRNVVASQKLDAIKVTVANGEEKISITMSPFSRDDNDTSEETDV